MSLLNRQPAFRTSPRSSFLVSSLMLLSGFAAAQNPWPHQDPEDWLLAFVDVETTGLIPGYHEMIDIGIVMTDLSGNELGELFLRIQPQHPERTDAGARAVNAFDEERWRALGALTADAAISRIVDFHDGIAGDRNVLMVAFNSQFDAAFLDHLFRSRGRTRSELYHYFVLDVPSMAWALGIRSLTGSSIADNLEVEDEPHVAHLHTGITGARLNARIYRNLISEADTDTSPNDDSSD
jgi:DNA polymerase III alpha subunit (gram-positive type)